MITIEELTKEIAMFPNEDLLPEDMLINYDKVRVGDIYKLLTEQVEAERERIVTGVKTLVYHVKGEIPGGLYSDNLMRGSRTEAIELINRFDVYKVISPEYSAQAAVSNLSCSDGNFDPTKTDKQ